MYNHSLIWLERPFTTLLTQILCYNKNKLLLNYIVQLSQRYYNMMFLPIKNKKPRTLDF